MFKKKMTGSSAQVLNSHENCKPAKTVPQVLCIVLFLVTERIAFH